MIEEVNAFMYLMYFMGYFVCTKRLYFLLSFQILTAKLTLNY